MCGSGNVVYPDKFEYYTTNDFLAIDGAANSVGLKVNRERNICYPHDNNNGDLGPTVTIGPYNIAVIKNLGYEIASENDTSAEAKGRIILASR